jgi:hypothetical protein
VPEDEVEDDCEAMKLAKSLLLIAAKLTAAMLRSAVPAASSAGSQ